jgi:hypothetical protein
MAKNRQRIRASQPEQQDAGEVLRRNIEGSRRLIEEKRRKSAAAGGQEPRPDDEPGRARVVPPGHKDMPEGGSSGSEENLGGGYKSEPRS